MVPCAVNIFWDPTLGALTHNSVPPPIPTPTFAIEMIATQMWTLGYLTGQNKLTTTVLHRIGPIVLEGHDIGMMIPDVTPVPFANAYYAIMWPFSSRKITFTASTVQMDKKMVGCSQVPYYMPMMTCGDPVSGPTAVPLINWMNTVHVGMTGKDIALGWVKIGVSVAIDLAFFFTRPPGSPINWGQEFLGKLFPTDLRALLKKEIQVLADTAISFWEGKPKVEIKVGMPGVLEVGVKVTPGNVTAEGTVIGGQDNPLDAGPWAKVSYDRDTGPSADADVGKPADAGGSPGTSEGTSGDAQGSSDAGSDEPGDGLGSTDAATSQPDNGNR